MADPQLLGTAAITNIGQLFEALAVDWHEPSSITWRSGLPANRYLMATEWNGSFIRIPALFRQHPYYIRGDHDIPVETGGYDMRGFIAWEIPQMFRGLFSVERADDGVWRSAELTVEGFRLAQAGLLVFDNSHPDIRRCAFFNPATRAAAADPRLPAPTAGVVVEGGGDAPAT